MSSSQSCRISQHQFLGTSRAYTRDARQRLIGHRLLVQSQVGRRKLTAGTGRVRGTLVVVRVALVKGEAVDCWAVVKGEADWAGATIVAKGLVVSGAGRLALAAWLEPLPLPFPLRRAFPCPLSGAPWGVLFRPRWRASGSVVGSGALPWAWALARRSCTLRPAR